jgi:hypothetical protein
MRLRLRLRALAGVPFLGGILTLALWMPIPTTGNAPLTDVLSEVHERLPGWHITRANASWEGGYTVVATCGARELGFQLVPEHGLGVGDAWVQPNDEYARSRLAKISDHDVYLVWYRDPPIEHSLSCRSELARSVHTGPADSPND